MRGNRRFDRLEKLRVRVVLIGRLARDFDRIDIIKDVRARAPSNEKFSRRFLLQLLRVLHLSTPWCWLSQSARRPCRYARSCLSTCQGDASHWSAPCFCLTPCTSLCNRRTHGPR